MSYLTDGRSRRRAYAVGICLWLAILGFCAVVWTVAVIVAVWGFGL